MSFRIPAFILAAAALILACSRSIAFGTSFTRALGPAAAGLLSERELVSRSAALRRHLAACPADAMAADLLNEIDSELISRTKA